MLYRFIMEMVQVGVIVLTHNSQILSLDVPTSTNTSLKNAARRVYIVRIQYR